MMTAAKGGKGVNSRALHLYAFFLKRKAAGTITPGRERVRVRVWTASIGLSPCVSTAARRPESEKCNLNPPFYCHAVVVGLVIENKTDLNRSPCARFTIIFIHVGPSVVSAEAGTRSSMRRRRCGAGDIYIRVNMCVYSSVQFVQVPGRDFSHEKLRSTTTH